MRGLCLVLLAMLWSGRSSAQTTLTLAFVSDPSGTTLAGSGTAAASVSFGSVRAFGGVVPSGVTKSVGASSWTLSTPIDFKVQKGALDVLDVLSTHYMMTASLLAADVQNTWKLNSVTLSTTAATIAPSTVYGTVAYTFALTIPFTAAAGTISNTISVTVTAI
jgi:hypothetical protein